MAETEGASPERPAGFTRRRVIGLIAAALALGMAVLWSIVVPAESGAPGLRGVVVRFGHPLAWALLSMVAALWAVDRGAKARSVLGLAALAAYIAFVAAIFLGGGPS